MNGRVPFLYAACPSGPLLVLPSAGRKFTRVVLECTVDPTISRTFGGDSDPWSQWTRAQSARVHSDRQSSEEAHRAACGPHPSNLVCSVMDEWSCSVPENCLSSWSLLWCCPLPDGRCHRWCSSVLWTVWRPRKRPGVMGVHEERLQEHARSDLKLNHASSDEQLPESLGLVSWSSDTAIRTGTCAHQSGDCGSKYPNCTWAVFQSTGLRSPEGWCFELERSCLEPKGPWACPGRNEKT